MKMETFTRFACDTGEYPLRVNVGQRNDHETNVKAEVGAVGLVTDRRRNRRGTVKVISRRPGPEWGASPTTAWELSVIWD